MNDDASTTTLTTDEQERAAFSSGYDNDTTSTPAAMPTETPAELMVEVTNVENVEPEPEYVQLTKGERDELFALREQAQKQFGTAFGKIGGIERRLQELNSGAQVEISQEDIDALRDDFPPLAAALEKVRNLRTLSGSVDPDTLDSMVAERVSKVEQKFELRLLAQAHPDWKQIDNDPAFQAWVAAQNDEFRQNLVAASQGYDSATVGDAMSKFKQSRKPAPAKPAVDDASARRSRMNAAVTPRGVGGPASPDLNDHFRSGYRE